MLEGNRSKRVEEMRSSSGDLCDLILHIVPGIPADLKIFVRFFFPSTGMIAFSLLFFFSLSLSVLALHVLLGKPKTRENRSTFTMGDHRWREIFTLGFATREPAWVCADVSRLPVY